MLIDRVMESWDVDAVTLDNVAAALQSTNYILDLGHRRIGTISGPPHVSTGADRLAGFKKALAAQNVALDPAHVRSGDFREDAAFSVAREMLALPNRPTALYVANNQMLIGVMRAIAEAGLACPADISVVSTDDFSWATAFRPRLTTVRQPVREMGAEAVRLLVERITAHLRGAGQAPGAAADLDRARLLRAARALARSRLPPRLACSFHRQMRGCQMTTMDISD